MDREFYFKNLDLIKKWGEGQTVQYKEGKNWVDIDSPRFNPAIKYRIKPTRKTVKRWVNIYNDEVRGLYLFKSRQSANFVGCGKAIACVEVDISWVEGRASDETKTY